MENISLHEIFKRSLNLTKYEEVSIASCKSCFALRTDKFVHFFHYSHAMQCRDKKLDMTETLLKIPIDSPASSLCSSKFIANGISGMDLSRIISDPAFWPHNKSLLREMTNLIDIKWAPDISTTNYPPVIATLNNVGNVEFFRNERKIWCSILNLSSHVKQILGDNINKVSSMEALKDAVYSLESCAICWSPTKNTEGSVFFASAQKNGVILIWLIKQQFDDIGIKYCGKVATNIEDIMSLMWISRGDVFMLICSTILGYIHGYKCQIVNGHVTILNTNTIWAHKDRMMSTKMDFLVVDDKIILICNKHRHVLIQMLNDNLQLLSQYLEDLNDHKITSIVKKSKGFYVSTINTKLFDITVHVNKDVLEVNKKVIEVKDLSSTAELCSLATSPNEVIFVLAFIDRKILNRKGPIRADLVFLYKEPSISELSILLDNPSKKLTDYWDCIELLRYKTMKTRALPQYDYNKLLLDGETDVYKLKLYFIILTFFKVLDDNLKVCGELLPENSIEYIKDKILFMNANSFIKKLYNKYFSNGLTEFDEECYVGCKRYIEYYCKKYKKEISTVETSDVLNLVNKDYEYLCQSCDENILLLSCIKNHLNLFCALSFSPIETNDYLICESCNLTARIELFDQLPLCSFCDFYLKRSYLK